MIVSRSLFISGRLLHVFAGGFHGREARPAIGFDGAAGELHGHDGRKALRERHHRGAEKIVEARRLGVAQLDVGRQRSHEAVGEQDAEEGSDERGGDVMSDLLDGSGDRLHRYHDAQDGRHDADARHRVAHLVERGDDLGVGFVVHVDLRLHEAVEIEGRHASDEHESERVAEEGHLVLLVQDRRITLEYGALLRVLDVRLDGHQAVAPGHLEQLEEQLEGVEIQPLREGRGLGYRLDLDGHAAEHRHGRRDQHRADAHADDDDVFRPGKEDPNGPFAMANPPSTDPMTTRKPTSAIMTCHYRLNRGRS